MIIFVVGGAKSGKSSYAEAWASKLRLKEGSLYYIATMNPYDCEDLKRIENHIENRKEYDFKTIEKKRDLLDIVNKFNNKDTLLLDSVTSLITNEMFIGEEFNYNVSEKLIDEINQLSNCVKNIVIVSDYVFSDSIKYDLYTNGFKRELGNINCNIAKAADVVVESVYGNLIFHKGREMMKDEKLI